MTTEERKLILDYSLRIYPNKNFCSKFEAKIFKLGEDSYKSYAYEKLGELEYILKTTPKHIQTKKLNRFLEYLDEPGENISDKGKHSLNGNPIDLWKSETFLDFKNRKAYAISFQLSDETTLVKCEFPCRNKKCRSDQCYFYTEQTKKSDESATIFVCCTKCKKRFKFS